MALDVGLYDRSRFLTVVWGGGWLLLSPQTRAAPWGGRSARPPAPLLLPRHRPATVAGARPTLCPCRSRTSALAAPAAWFSPSPPFIYPRRTVFLKIKHTLAGEDTPSMCILSLPGSCSGCWGSLCSRSWASGARNAAQGQAVWRQRCCWVAGPDGKRWRSLCAPRAGHFLSLCFF